MAKVTEYKVIGHHGDPYNITELSCKIDSIREKVIISWSRDYMRVRDKFFPIPKYDIVKFLEKNM